MRRTLWIVCFAWGFWLTSQADTVNWKRGAAAVRTAIGACLESNYPRPTWTLRTDENPGTCATPLLFDPLVRVYAPLEKTTDPLPTTGPRWCFRAGLTFFHPCDLVTASAAGDLIGTDSATIDEIMDRSEVREQLEAARQAFLERYYTRGLDNAHSKGDLEYFAFVFSGDDPKGLIPIAQQRMHAIDDQALFAEDRRRQNEQLAAAEREIAYCNSATKEANRQLARETRIGSVGNVVDKEVLHSASEVIVDCRDQMPQLIRRYRQLGGTANPAALTDSSENSAP